MTNSKLKNSIIEKSNEVNDAPTVAIMFAGGGGDALGFVSAGFNLVFANDSNPDACKTLKQRYGEEVIHKGNIKNVSNFRKSNVISGGFPCQGFSVAGPRKTSDERNNLYQYLKKSIEQVKPEFFVAENVKGFVTLGEKGGKQFFKNGKIQRLGKTSQAIIDELESVGYAVYYELHNTKHFGIPQDRERIIIVGVRNDIDFKFKFPRPITDGISMEEYGIKKIKVNEDDIYRESKGDKKDYFSSRYMSRNRIRKWNQPSFTIPAEASQVPACPDCTKMWGDDKMSDMSDEEMVKGFEQYKKHVAKDLRRLSWRQCAAIQGFPQNYKFAGDIVSIYKQIGNAVPPKLMQQIANCIMPYFKGEKSSF